MAERRERRRETMKGTIRRPILNYFEDNDWEEQGKDEGMVMKGIEREDTDEIVNIVERVQCTTHLETAKRGEDISREKYYRWRQEQKTRAARLLWARKELDELIEDQLNRFRAHYNHAMVPTQLKDVAELLMPKWAPPHELAALSWLGDWRPSAILDLVRGLNRSSPSASSSSSSAFSSGSGGFERLLSQVMHEIHIEEAIIEEEMAEIQAKCVLHLRFTPLVKKKSGGSALGFIQEEFKKIEQVIVKAHKLRFKALELVVKKVLSKHDAVEFFVAFAGIQDAIHQVADPQKLRKVLVTLPSKALGSS